MRGGSGGVSELISPGPQRVGHSLPLGPRGVEPCPWPPNGWVGSSSLAPSGVDPSPMFLCWASPTPRGPTQAEQTNSPGTQAVSSTPTNWGPPSKE